MALVGGRQESIYYLLLAREKAFPLSKMRFEVITSIPLYYSYLVANWHLKENEIVGVIIGFL